MESHQIDSMDDAREFILAGNAYFTLRSRATGTRFTYRVRASEDGRVHFVSVLSGSDNENAYSYFGIIKAGREWRHGGAKARAAIDSPSVAAFAWFWRRAFEDMPTSLEFWHEGRCGRCGRLLTVPESLARGIGPECAKRVFTAQAA